MKYTRIEPPDTIHDIFVFGSNMLGIHGAGAAKVAANHYGAERGIRFGHRGRSFAIPTCSRPGKPLELFEIQFAVDGFIEYAHAHPELRFHVTQIGCGNAGYKPKDIAPMFDGAPPNVILPPEFIWPDMPEDYTCGCGLYVHASRRNYDAIHIEDCKYK